ncbi:hypothetical protein [Bacillus alkalicellulosilyticus]|uniref:hypothetical protein n=1 Tax=Alkalihalobacterium alkalicellulosilyticum TaxID=1912214 RepID=UPI000998BEDE|nr:hypothetical protein [Bacillus alkalicellulosilyticus]
MFEIVKTHRQQKKFEETWEYICSRHGWYNDPYSDDAVRYNLLMPHTLRFLKPRVVGTIEFIPYSPNNPFSTVEGPSRANFTSYNDIQKHQTRTWEIDKLCIHEQYQRKGHFKGILEIFYNHAITYSPKFYIALMDKKFYRMLKILYGVAIEQRGDAIYSGKDALLPIVFDVEKVMANEELINKYLNRKTLTQA